MAGDVTDGGTALAGLLLVYLGALAVRYDSLDNRSKTDKRDQFQRHAWLALSGIVLALAAAFFALIAEATKSRPLTIIAAIALIVSFGIAAVAAYWNLKGTFYS
jgi:predicted ferric reductase